MSQKWVVINVSTGERVERWPVDAKDMIATGDWELEHADSRPLVETALSSKGEPLVPARMTGVVMPQDTPRVIVKAEDAPAGQIQTIPTGRTAGRRR